jgi:DNA recombination protein RmuC
LRIPGLFESIQRELKVIITGPTTLSAILTSLQMGFRTLAIEKRSSEVWDILGLVKKEFTEFGSLIHKTEKKLQEVTNTIKKVGIRNRALTKSLRSVEELPDEKIEKLLEDFNLQPSTIDEDPADDADGDEA